MAKHKHKDGDADGIEPQADEQLDVAASPPNETPDDNKADEKTDGKTADKLVRVQLMHAIAFGGIALRPRVETKPGRGQLIRPVEAIIPKAVADSYPDRQVETLADAPEGAVIGIVAPEAD